MFYLAAISECFWVGNPSSVVTVFGMAMYLPAICLSAWGIRKLGRYWTVKLLVAPGQRLVTYSLFKRQRVPYYYLSLIPELAGLSIALQAFGTLIVGLPLYLILVLARIRQEARMSHAAVFMD